MRKLFETGLWSLAALPLIAGQALAEPAAGGMPNPTDGWNHTWNEVLWDLWIIGGIFAVVAVYLLVKYKAKSPNAVGTAQPLNLDKALAWSLVPAALFMADDFLLAAKGWSLWNIQRTVPTNAMEIKVSGNQWFFEYDYGGGVKDTELVVPVGQPIVLRMTSNDVIHSFGLNDYRVKEDMMPGRITYLWFYPDKPLETQVVCVEFCGMAHSQMTNKVRAVEKAAYDEWLAKKIEKSKKKTSELDQKKSAEAASGPVTAR
jgi:cytochrome c oxidase subunit 2